MDEILNIIKESQTNYIKENDKSYIKKKSQFFTPVDIAEKMIKSLDLIYLRTLTEIDILEPAAGCGLLLFVALDYIIKNTNITKINIVAYESDINVCNILRANTKLIKNHFKSNNDIALRITVLNHNFITYNHNKWLKDKGKKYDLIVSNPPFKKLNQTSPESLVMKNIVFGQPNIYIFFIAMSLSLLKPNGLYTVLSPRNYLNGSYSVKVREYIFNNYNLTNIYFFDKRNLFEQVNQEVIIATYKNSKTKLDVLISNESSDFSVPISKLVYNKDTFSIFIPRKFDDINIFNQISNLNHTISELNIKISVGPIVQFRNTDDLSDNIYNNEYAPLLIGNDIQENNKLVYIERINKRKTHNKSLKLGNKNLIINSNYLIIRKVTAKDDKKLIVSCVLEKDFFNSDFLALDNNLLFFSSIDNSELNLELCYGLYCFINSLYFQNLYYIINGTHTINVSDFTSIKFPSLDQLNLLGNYLIREQSFTTEACSLLIDNI